MAQAEQTQGGVAIKLDRKPKTKAEIVRINHKIVAREVRVISPEGEQLGILSTDEARRTAESRGMDLVEVSPDSRPPVCRIMDYGKYKYTMKKKQQSAKKRALSQSVKEVKFRPKTEEHDYNVKLKHITRFLQDGDKAKVTVRFRGREMAHKELGMVMLQRIIKDIGEMSIVASEPLMEGRLLQMVLNPSPKALVIKRSRDEKRRVQEEKKKAELHKGGHSPDEAPRQLIGEDDAEAEDEPECGEALPHDETREV